MYKLLLCCTPRLHPAHLSLSLFLRDQTSGAEQPRSGLQGIGPLISDQIRSPKDRASGLPPDQVSLSQGSDLWYRTRSGLPGLSGLAAASQLAPGDQLDQALRGVQPALYMLPIEHCLKLELVL